MSSPPSPGRPATTPTGEAGEPSRKASPASSKQAGPQQQLSAAVGAARRRHSRNLGLDVPINDATPILVADDDAVNRAVRAVTSPSCVPCLILRSPQYYVLSFPSRRVLTLGIPQVLGGMLQRMGMRPQRDFDMAEDGVQTVEMAARRPYRLILLDVQVCSTCIVDLGNVGKSGECSAFVVCTMSCQMPRMDGFEATKRVLAAYDPSRAEEQPPQPHAPPFICVISGGVLDEERERCFEAGARAFIAKPYQADEIRDVCHATLRSVGMGWPVQLSTYYNVAFTTP